MGLFKKKGPEKSYSENQQGLPELPPIPDYPNLSELPSLGDERDYLNKNSFDNKFSQSAIKNAVIGAPGEKEGRDFSADESNINWMMPRSPRVFTKEIESSTKMPEMSPQTNFPRQTSIQPVFIRLDKFEESLHTFRKTKTQVTEIEKMLREIKRMKEEEEKELQYWEEQIQAIKNQIERVDKDIFSKVE